MEDSTLTYWIASIIGPQNVNFKFFFYLKVLFKIFRQVLIQNFILFDLFVINHIQKNHQCFNLYQKLIYLLLIIKGMLVYNKKKKKNF